MFKNTLSLAIGAAALVAAQLAGAASLPVQPVLTLAAAQQVISAAQAKAQAENWPCVISVVDAAGLPLALVRMDNAAVPAGVEIAPGKARTAALFRRPSGALEDAINGNRPAVATARGFVLMRGGLPLVADGQIVGAIGVSADTPQHDEEIARAGAAALK
ncbi:MULTISPECIES: heme-binding protein [unclassified Herbaspirillum]|uniref:GlcG/HbpS family heme-binding protein n=1 Tax=unclassified Herbaspirillum TaxID=2624150 RepID=UPI00114D94E2|nr:MULTISPECIES: heme-binding protein [unclassified Herbaspirillum]MBB5391499.1 glc operon protein GlcG [Herbaspirillum sp. SJZ102]TQK12817.1 glc operon protein GlcG [Herbaspirillum sp. SJZ130]TQK14821.1 glc operon protein GlcG [Herbaspirillum sp. SJZ106]